MNLKIYRGKEEMVQRQERNSKRRFHTESSVDEAVSHFPNFPNLYKTQCDSVMLSM